MWVAPRELPWELHLAHPQGQGLITSTGPRVSHPRPWCRLCLEAMCLLQVRWRKLVILRHAVLPGKALPAWQLQGLKYPLQYASDLPLYGQGL